MNANMWMQLLAVTLIAGAAVSKSTYAVLSRVGERQSSDVRPERILVGSSGSSTSRSAADELAMLISVEPSCVRLTSTRDNATRTHEVHCSIQVDPSRLLSVAAAAEAQIDHAFRDRHHWSNARIIVHVET